VRKNGVNIILCRKESARDLFERSRPHLLNPIRKKIYVEHGNVPNQLSLSGLTALSELTMLSVSQAKTVAYYGKVTDLTGTDTLIDDNEQAGVEIWRYDPLLLSDKPGIVDPLSLAASLQTVEDERVEQAVEDILTNLWGHEKG
jgi:hypothetical protein